METIKINDRVSVRIERDTDPYSPANWDNVGEIAYCSSQYCLGTERVTPHRMNEIAQGIRFGDLIGMPVFAYVHSGSTIKAAETNPFRCEWDSGQSGFVYCTVAKGIEEFGTKRDQLNLAEGKVRKGTAAMRAKTLKCLIGEVATFDQYLQGDVYGYVIEVDGEEKNSCWGFYGLEYAKQEATSAAQHYAK